MIENFKTKTALEKECKKIYTPYWHKADGTEFSHPLLIEVVDKLHPVFKLVDLKPEKFRVIKKHNPETRWIEKQIQAYYGEKWGWRKTSLKVCFKKYTPKHSVKDDARTWWREYTVKHGLVKEKCEICGTKDTKLHLHHADLEWSEIFDTLWNKHFKGYEHVDFITFYKDKFGWSFEDWFYHDHKRWQEPVMQAFFQDLIEIHKHSKLITLCSVCHKKIHTRR